MVPSEVPVFVICTDVLVTARDEQLGEKRMTMVGSISCGGLAGRTGPLG